MRQRSCLKQQESTSLIGAPGPLQPGPHHLYPGKIQNGNGFLLQLIFFISILLKYEVVGLGGHASITAV
ncbi:hypothetical protein QFZ28_005224 [Neobacillus niacini]|uniref:hypothetical protein n=1 Tax=Neobacillus niacini TaxID=86668 RepID=UPI0027800959|nr:hypothetical protein [Neobacillus niacini]MDQ1004684.1 hypothetical protein [Neobacillus niacini]